MRTGRLIALYGVEHIFKEKNMTDEQIERGVRDINLAHYP